MRINMMRVSMDSAIGTSYLWFTAHEKEEGKLLVEAEDPTGFAIQGVMSVEDQLQLGKALVENAEWRSNGGET